MNGVVEPILHRNTPLMINNVHFIEKKIVKNIGLEKMLKLKMKPKYRYYRIKYTLIFVMVYM